MILNELFFRDEVKNLSVDYKSKGFWYTLIKHSEISCRKDLDFLDLEFRLFGLKIDNKKILKIYKN